jgi:hypothetical protein
MKVNEIILKLILTVGISFYINLIYHCLIK